MSERNFPDNRINLVGNLGADPKVEEKGDGKGYAEFTIYKNNDYTDKTTNEEVKMKPDKLDVVVFESMNEAFSFAKRLKGGDFVRVFSEPSTSTVDEGEKSRKYTRFKAFDIKLIKPKAD